MKIGMKIFLIILSAILALILAFLVILSIIIGFMIFVPQMDVDTSIDAWVELQEEHSYLPAISEMGYYEDVQCKYQHRENLVISSDAYILRATYSQENFDAQKDYILNTYSFQNTVTDEIGEETIQKNASFLFDGYDFKMLSLEEYDLWYPKYFAFVGFCKEKQEICFIYFEDIELDYISGSFEDFFMDECGW